MEPIIPPVDRELLRAELTPERKASDTEEGRERDLYLPGVGVPGADA